MLGGIDFVQLRKDNENSDNITLGKRGSKDLKAYLGPYEFWFLSEENVKDFTANSSTYAPQFGGYCAWGLTGFDSHVTDPSG